MMKKSSFTKRIKIKLFSLILISANVSFAQPSDATILSKLKSGSKSSDLISIALTKAKGYRSEEYVNGSKVVTFSRGYKAKYNTEWKGVTITNQALIIYNLNGGKWVFSSKTVPNVYYEGFKNPSEEEIVKLVNISPEKIVGSYLSNYVVAELSNMHLSEEVNWYWTEPTRVTFNLNMTYNEKTVSSETKVQKLDAIYRITLDRDAADAPWRFGGASHKSQTVLNEKILSKKEYDALMTLQQASVIKQNEADLALLPSIEIPKYKNHIEMMLHLMQLVRSGDVLTVEAYLRKTFAASYFEPNMEGVFTNYGADLMNKALAGVSGYVNQYCESPLFETTGNNFTRWYNKDNSTMSLLETRDLGNGQREIVRIEFNVFPTDNDNAKKLTGITCKTHSNPLIRTKKAKLNTTKGAYVFSRYGNSEWSYIGQINGATSSGYSIKWLDGSTSNEPASSISNYELLPGDEVYYKNSSGNINKAWISENKGTMGVTVADINGKQWVILIKNLRFK